MKEFIAEKQKKVSELVQEYYGSAINFSTIMKLFRKKDIRVDGVKINKDVEVQQGSKISVYFDGLEEKAPEVIFEDENILVLYKPEGISSEDFFVKAERYCKESKPVHRLDRNTDGLMIFSKNKKSYEELLEGFKNRNFEKYYLAEVYGQMPKDADTLVGYLQKNEEKSTVKIYDKPVPESSKIITKYKVLHKGSETSILEVELVTGKTHQIRAHLASIGHFIIGDGKYGKVKINRKFHLKSQALTAYKMVFHFEDGKHLHYLDGKLFEYAPALKKYNME